MDIKKIGVIISREYLNRVKKKSFLIVTFVVPLLFALLCFAPALIMNALKDEDKKVAVVDNSGIVLDSLSLVSGAEFRDYTSMGADSAKASLSELGMDALLCISPLDSSQLSVSIVSYSSKPLGMELSSGIEKAVNGAVEAYRIGVYGIDAEVMAKVRSDVTLTTYTLDESGDERLSSETVYMLISMLMGMLIYLFIALFGAMVMSSVIEEKASRVVEVLVSSVRPVELMAGKIIGVALVALTQFFLWIVLIGAIVGVAGAAFPDMLASSAEAAGSMQMAEGSMQMAGSEIPSATGDLQAVLSTLSSLNYGLILSMFAVYFILGYLLYASMFAAIGSAAENEADTQQLQIPLTIPLVIGFLIAIYAFKSPDSGVVFWSSMIPFTSPIVMLARLPLSVPVTDLVLSIAILVATIVLFAWASARIYRNGILSFGKKRGFADLWKWFKQN